MADAPAVPLEHNRPALSVTELSSVLKRMVESEFDHVRVRGEISGFKRHTSGHCYFALKDEDAVLDGVVWKAMAARLGMKPEDGMEVIATDPLLSPAEIVRRGAAPVHLDTLLESADFVSLHCPRDASTLRLMNAGTFARMKRGAIFITTARGESIIRPSNMLARVTPRSLM